MIIRIRIALLILGVVAFGVALNQGIEWLRWVGIVCAAAALLMRFIPKT
jgi:hypothetical protein